MSTTLSQLDKNAIGIRAIVTHESFETKITEETPSKHAQVKKAVLSDMKEAVTQLNSIRAGDPNNAPINLTFDQFLKQKWGFGSFESFLRTIELNGSRVTTHQLMNMGDFNEGYRWLNPEIIREAIRLGMDMRPMWSELILREESISQPSVIMPYINRSDAMPNKLGESETIPTGAVSFGQKSVGTQKMGIGMKVTDEVLRYVPLNIMAIFFQDMGTKLNDGLTNMAVDVLINGDGNSNAAPVIGVDTTGSISYVDLLRAWIRLGMITRQPQIILSGENMAIETLSLPEFTTRDTLMAGIDNKQVTLRTPIPRTQDIWISGAMPTTNQIMLLDKTKALIKLNAAPLMMENERIAERQVSGTYATLTTGFAKIYTDATLIIDKSLAFSSNGFPSYMDYAAYQKAQVIRS